MSSSLTRSVFRRLVRGQPIRYRGCVNHPLFRPLLPPQKSTVHIHQRPIFGFAGSFQRPSGFGRKEQLIRHHLDVLLNTSRQLAFNFRTPSAEVIAKSWVAFFTECKESQQMVTDYHAKAALEVWKYLQETEGVEPVLSADDAAIALMAMADFDHGLYTPKDWNIYKRVFQIPQREPFDISYVQLASRLVEFIPVDSQNELGSTELLIRCFTNAGYPEMALELLLTQPSKLSDYLNWSLIISAAKGSSSAILQVADAIKKNKKYIHDTRISVILCQALFETAMLNSTDVVEGEMDIPQMDELLNGEAPDLEIVNDFIRTAMLLSWPQKEKLEDMVEKALSFLHRASKKELDEQEHNSVIKKLYDTKLALILSRHHDLTRLTPTLDELAAAEIPIDENTLSLLLQTALLQHDTELAEKLVTWADDIGIRHWKVAVASEYVKYYLARNDLKSAMPYYLALQSPGIEEIPSSLMGPIEELLVKEICLATSPDEISLERMHEIVEKRPSEKRWTPETLEALTYFSLRHEDYEEVVELLKRHLPYYTLADRQKLTNEIISFSFRPTTSPDGQWNSYVILTAINASLDRNTSYCYMKAFIQANFEEEALQTFAHMRNNSDPELRPDASIYIAALNDLGALGDVQAVRAIHNHLKLDINVEPSVLLWTALMKAYLNCNEPHYSLIFWDQILDMAPGPDEQSVIVALDACKTSPGGSLDVQRVWQPIIARGMAVTPTMFSSYVATLVSTGNIEEAKTEIEVKSEKYDRISR